MAHTSGLSLEVAKQLEVGVELGRATMPLCARAPLLITRSSSRRSPRSISVAAAHLQVACNIRSTVIGLLVEALLRWRSFCRGEVWVHPGRSDGSGEFAEGGSDAKTAVPGFEPEFVVAAPQVLDEGMPCDDCPR